MSPIAQGLFHQWNLWSKGDMDDTRYVKEREREEERERERERKREGREERERARRKYATRTTLIDDIFTHA